MEKHLFDIIKIKDSDGNVWHEVDYLSQTLVPTEKQNININDGRFLRFKDSVPYILGSLKTDRKFIKNIYQMEIGYTHGMLLLALLNLVFI